MAESSSQQQQQHKKHNSNSSTGSGGGAAAGDSKKWACAYCTYLNWEANYKCVLCNQARNRPMLIEELCPPVDDGTDATHSGYSLYPDDQQLQLTGIGADELAKWPCPTCTYMNCRRTKRCVQCRTDRPAAYKTPPNSKGSSPKGSNADGGGHGHAIQPSARKNSQQQNLQETQQLISRALNKWSCPTCTFDNWPTASKCTICGQPRSATTIREQSNSPPTNQPQQAQRKRKAISESESFGHSSSSSSSIQSQPFGTKKLRISDEGESQQQLRRLEEKNVGGAADLEQLDRLSIAASGPEIVVRQQDYASALDIYARRFLASDPVEKLYFRAAGAIGHRELQMVNKVVDYLINEGNLQRPLTAFEARLMNQYIARGGTCRVVGFERADSLFFLAKKSDCLDLMKLIRRVRTDDDRLPCALNCAARTRLFAKVTAQCMAVRDGPSGSGQFLKCQFIAHPHNFNLLNMPMPGSDLSLAVQNALFRPAPCIPPQLCYIDCFDVMASQGGLIVGRPPNFLMRNRGGANSLYDSVFQAMFGVCDRFNILRAAAKFTLHRSSHLFKARWLEQQRRMIRDCGLSVGAGELDADWDDLLNSVGEEDECTEPIHIWALAHICCRPIIVCPMDDPVDVDELLSPLGGNGAGIGRSASPRGGQGGRMAGVESQNEECNEGGGDGRRHQQHEEKAQPRQTNYHIYEGIFLPILWAPSAPISRLPLIISYRNGLFHAVAISDALYQRDAEVQRYVRIRRPLRRPGTAGDSLFRFLTRNELDNSALLAQFILFGHSTAQQLSIRREPHSFLPETLHFYKNWMQAMLQLSDEGNGTCGTTSTNQLESRMDAIFMCNKKRKGGGGDGINSPSAALLQPHQQALMVQLFSPQITTQPSLTQQQQSEAGDETAAFGRWQQTDD